MKTSYGLVFFLYFYDTRASVIFTPDLKPASYGSIAIFPASARRTKNFCPPDWTTRSFVMDATIFHALDN
jgi:hypothetical protein